MGRVHIILLRKNMGSYPGADYQMSMYGLRELNPEETAGQWKEFIKTQHRIHDNHIAIRGNGTLVWPGEPVRSQTPATYFSNIKQTDNSTSQYDRMFHAESGYNSKLHREDRQHTVGLDIEAEERCRLLPVRASSEYGRRVDVPLEDAAERAHVRIDRIMKGFYRTNGTGIPTSSSPPEECQ